MAQLHTIVARWHTLKGLPAVVSVTCLFALPMWPQAASMPPPGDPEVFHIYLRQVHREVENLKQPDAVSSATPPDARTHSAAARLGVSPEDLPVIDTVYRNLAAILQSIEAEGRAYVEQRTEQQQRPDMTKLAEFHARRTGCIKEARDQLRRVLSDTAWRRLEGFLDGEFRMRVKRRTLQ